jgi:hypothetical protein
LHLPFRDIACSATDWRLMLLDLAAPLARAILQLAAKLLKRVFALDLEHGPSCGGELKIIATILERPVIEKILTRLGLQARAPPRAPARGQALQAA